MPQWLTGAFTPITLDASKTYYLEALWQEGGGGDGCEVTYIMEGDAIRQRDLSALTGNIAACT
jgi:hypothetical protein